MTLNPEQRAELEALGPETVRMKVAVSPESGAGRGADVPGFRTGRGGGGYLTRGDVEDWLAEKHAEQTRLQNNTLWWAKTAAIATIVLGIASIIVTVWTAK